MVQYIASVMAMCECVKNYCFCLPSWHLQMPIAIGGRHSEYCNPKYFSGQNVIVFCSNQQYF